MRWPLLFLTASPWPCAGLTYAGPYSTSFPYTMRGFASHVTIPANTNMLSSPARHQQLFPSCSSQHCTGLEVFTFATATARGCIVGATCSPHWVINEPHIQAQDPKKSEGREEKKIPQLLPWKRVNSGLFPKSREIKLPFGLKAHSCSLQHIRPESLLAKRRISKSKGP